MTLRVKNVNASSIAGHGWASWTWWDLDVDGTIVDRAGALYTDKDHATRYATQKSQGIARKHSLWDHNIQEGL